MQIGSLPLLPPSGATPSPAAGLTDRDARLLRAAQELEALFLSQMLDHAGLGKASESFGGGIGEEQFGSFLRDAQAREIAARGGIGLAQHLFNALKDRPNDG